MPHGPSKHRLQFPAPTIQVGCPPNSINTEVEGASNTPPPHALAEPQATWAHHHRYPHRPHHASTGAERNVGSCTCRHINTSRNTASRGTYLLCRRVSGMLTFFTEPRPASSTPGAQLPFDSGWDTRHRRGEKASAYARGQPRYDSYQGRHTYL